VVQGQGRCAYTPRTTGLSSKKTSEARPLPADQWACVTIPTLDIDGGSSPVWMRNAMRSLANVLPNAHYCTLERQTHNVKPKALAPVLVEFFQR
jgi:hypothetical protein